MESIDAYSNSDLVWLLFGYRSLFKTGAIVGTFVCYHTFRTLRRKRIADILNDAAEATVAAARLASANVQAGNASETLVGNNDDDDDDDEDEDDKEGNKKNTKNARGKEAKSNKNNKKSNKTSSSAPRHHQLTSSAIQQQQSTAATTLRDDDDLNLIRRINLAIDPQAKEEVEMDKNGNNNDNDKNQPSSAASPLKENVVVAESSITDFPLLTAQRSLTTALDFLNPGQTIAEIVAIILECQILLHLTRATLGPIAPNSIADSDSCTMLPPSMNSDDQSNFTFNFSILKRWAKRFYSAPPVALDRVFGELQEGESMKIVGSGSLVAKSLLGAILYRDALGISAIPLLPTWFGCLVTPMCVRYPFVESDLRHKMTWRDVRSIACANAIRSLCHSFASVLQETWISFWRSRKIRSMEKEISKIQKEIHAFDDGDDYILPSSELTIEEAREKVSVLSAKRTSLLESAKFIPEKLFSGFLLSDSAQTHLIAAASNALWCLSADWIGLSAVLFLKKIFKPTSFRAQIAITCARMFCQASTLTGLRLLASKFVSSSSSSSSSKKNASAMTESDKKSSGHNSNEMLLSPGATNPESTGSTGLTPAKTPGSLFGNKNNNNKPPPTPPRGSTKRKNAAANNNTNDSSAELPHDNHQEEVLLVNPLRKTIQTRIGRSAVPPPPSSSASPLNTITPASSSAAFPAQSMPNSPQTDSNRQHPAFPRSPALHQQQNNQQQYHHQNNNNNAVLNTPLSSALPPPVVASQSVLEQHQQRRRLLNDLDKAFGGTSSLALSHISDAVHSMLSSLTPDNNLKIHALLYLHAVDEYVTAVGQGELQRNFQKIYQPFEPAPFCVLRSQSPSTTATPQSSSLFASQHHHQNQSASSASTTPPTSSSTPSSSTSMMSKTAPPATSSASQNVFSSAIPSSSLPPPSHFMYNLQEQKQHIHIPTHTFTAEEITERKAIAAKSASVKPFYCVACKYTFREGYRAFILPCGHLVHDSCGTRLRSDWCPRCVRPFEKPASNDRTIKQFHQACSKLQLLQSIWDKHILLPPHLWFSEWRRVRHYIIQKCDEDKLKMELKALHLEKIRLTQFSDGMDSLATISPNSQSSNPSGSNNNTSGALFTISSIGGANNKFSSFIKNLQITPTWAQHLVETQIVFAIPDDFSPSGYGFSDVPLMATLSALGVSAVNRQHERTVAMVHETMVDGRNGTNSMTSNSRILHIGAIRV